MVEALYKKHLNFQKAHSAFTRAIITKKELAHLAKSDNNVNDLLSSGVIQHFELAYETLWKFLKEYLNAVHEIEVASPRETFRACYTYKVLPENFVNELIQLADARNKTTHIYDQILAQEVYNDVIKHHHVMNVILDIIKLPTL